MIEIIVLICLADDPKKCRDEVLTFAEESVTLFTCSMYGQFEIARRMEFLPRWRVAKWRCEHSKETARL